MLKHLFQRCFDALKRCFNAVLPEIRSTGTNSVSTAQLVQRGFDALTCLIRCSETAMKRWGCPRTSCSGVDMFSPTRLQPVYITRPALLHDASQDQLAELQLI